MREQTLCLKYGLTFIKNQYGRNYAGNLNTAIDHIIRSRMIENNESINHTFIAFLDDDDFWHSEYLAECTKAIKKDTDFVVAGLIYHSDNQIQKLSIPNKLTIQDFLEKNPHIQGSNTFIRLTTLLKAGGFDENMPSTTDRDVFTRVMMLNPKYEIIQQHLVNIDAKNSRVRLTNTQDSKKESLAKFYAKYGGLMSESNQKAFFQRANLFTSISEQDITEVLEYQAKDYVPIQTHLKVSQRVVFAFVSISPFFTKRMIAGIARQNLKNKKIICIANYADDIEEIKRCLFETNIPYLLVTLVDIHALLNKKNIFSCLDQSCLKNGYVQDIATARSILHFYAKQESEDGDIVWILDDDMEFAQNVMIDGTISKQPLDIEAVIQKYQNKYDVVVGSYSQDAPLPTLSSLRTALLDYVYHHVLKKNQYYDKSIYHFRDYYYDLADDHRHLETPVQFIENGALADIFSGKATSRKLFSTQLAEFDAYSRGGNTLIFNRKVLDIPNLSLVLAGTVARRSDYFWVQQVKKQGYRIIGSTFSTFHHREGVLFDYQKEVDKQIKDLIGSSFTKAYADITSPSSREFYGSFKRYYQQRLVRIVGNYFRIIGLLNILNSDDYLVDFNETNLADFIRRSKQYLEPSLVYSAFKQLCSQIHIHQHSLKISKYQAIVENHFSTHITHFLGWGEEGAVFSDGSNVYKIMYERLQDEVLQRYVSFGECSELFAVKTKQLDEHTIIYYSYSENYQPYLGGFSIQLAGLLNFLKSKRLVLTNIKKQNFIIVDKQLKFIDYGKNIEPYSLKKYQKSIERAYQMLKYPDLSTGEYKQMISQSYLEEDKAFLFGIEHFRKSLAKRYKEQTHDPIVIDLIKQINPISVLDYGAGKCKIANVLAQYMSVSVFDINREQLKARAHENVTVVEDIEKTQDSFDLVNCNLVLCCTNNQKVEYILGKAYNLLDDDGHLILSICNPFFDDIEQTETRLSGNYSDYSLCKTYQKKTRFICREEYHRPFAFYQRMLQKKGFEIIEIREDDGVNVKSLNPISEHLIMVCRKVEKPILHDCSLLIKTNPMEYQTIYKNITHIVQQLEKNCLFAERIVVVDGDAQQDRLRRYSSDNREILLDELNRLLANGYIDRIVITNKEQRDGIYRKYFGGTVNSAYAANGQALLSSLQGLNAVKTRYVFQNDSDILYHNSSVRGVQSALNVLKAQQALTLSLSICHSNEQLFSFGHRVEVRSSFIDLQQFNQLLPLSNPTEQDSFSLPWHRALDNRLNPMDSIRLHQTDLFFVHPENALKNTNLISMARNAIEQNKVNLSHQVNKVNLSGAISDWLEKTHHQMVLFIRGKNTPPEKLKRLFDSIKKQKHQYFQIIYIDDASNEASSAYAKMLFEYDVYFKNKVISVFNDFSVDSLANFEIMYQHIVKNPNTIIVNIDNDDCLLKDEALSIIQAQFDKGADVTIGNCFRVDKPLKHYRVEAFKESWERDGDNIWLHPKCFRKYLCNYIQNNLMFDDRYIDVATDYAMMLPIIQAAKQPVFIQEPIYYFEPSKENRNKANQYQSAAEMKQILLERAKRDSQRKVIAIIGDSNVSEQSNAYQLAYELGKVLVDNGFRIQTGGLGGVMEAAMKGAKSSCCYQRGDTIAIIPSSDETEVNDYADIVIPTGLDILRNGKVVEADVVIALGGGAGTLSE